MFKEPVNVWVWQHSSSVDVGFHWLSCKGMRTCLGTRVGMSSPTLVVSMATNRVVSSVGGGPISIYKALLIIL